MLVLTTAVFSQNCFKLDGPAKILQELDNTYTLIFKYNNNGNKALGILIKCDGMPIAGSPFCFEANGSGTKDYKLLICPSGNISAVLTPSTGNCGSSSCADTTVFGPGFGPTPVKLSSFSAVRSKQIAMLNWNTEIEIDAKEFIVERAEGTEFRSVGSIKSNGNSSVRKSYSFNDKNENANTTYYRLKNIDLNGSFTYSEIRTVKGIGAVNDVTVFPNPARSNSKISVVGVTANSSIQLLDFSGKVLKNMNSTTVNSLDLSGVKNGTYLIRIIDKASNEIVNKTLTVSN